MTTVFHAWLYGRFAEIQSKLKRKKLNTSYQSSNIFGGNFSNRDNIRGQSNLEEKVNLNNFKKIIKRNKAKCLIWNTIKPTSMKKTNMPNPVESPSYINWYSSSSPRPVKALAILSDTTVTMSVDDRKDLNHTGNQKKRPHFSRSSTILLFTSFSNILLTTERRLTGQWFLVANLSPTFLNTGTTNNTLQQSRKQDSFRHILKSSVSICESSGSQFFRTNTRIQSGPDTFDESSLLRPFETSWKLQKYYAVSD